MPNLCRHRLMLLALLLAVLPLQAQPAPAATAAATGQPAVYAPRTGDEWIDRALAGINDYAARYPDSLVDEVSRYLDVARDYAQALLKQPGWHAGDLYFACALAKATGKPCREVVRAWSRDRAGGWRGVAKTFDAQPGSAEYGKIRETLRASHAHWARPLPIR
ncbi:MAG: hypothetical protein QM599_09990 [Pseudoxanthomonas sp.]